MPENESASSINLSVEFFRRLLIGRRWYILGTAAVIIFSTIAVLLAIPNKYRSEATLLVVQQQVPERYVTPTTTTELVDALQVMQREALSRARLLGIIEEFDLYQKERKRLAPEQIIALMRKDIEIVPLDASPQRHDFNSFMIAFVSNDPHVAQGVTSRLTGIFIEQNLRSREEQATSTTRFLQEQLDASRKKLADQEERVRDFKMQYLGELPEQQQGNLGILAGIQSQLQNTMASLSRAQEQRVYLESLLGGYRNMAARSAAISASAVAGQSLQTLSSIARPLTPAEAAQNELVRLQTERQKLLRQFTPNHPDLIRNGLEIAKAEATFKELRAAEPQASARTDAQSSAASSLSLSRPNPDDEPSVAQVRGQLESNRVEIENLLKDEKHLKASLEQYQNRLNATPVREQQLAGIMRDYTLTKQEYADLVNKEMQSQLASSLEKRQQGMQFRLVDPPSLPIVPFSPKRLPLSLGAIAGGLVLGVAIAFMMELKLGAAYTPQDLVARFAAPLVVGIPLVLTPSEVRKRWWIRRFDWVAGSVLMATVLLAEFYVYRHR